MWNKYPLGERMDAHLWGFKNRARPTLRRENWGQDLLLAQTWAGWHNGSSPLLKLMLLWCFHLSGNLVSKADAWMEGVHLGFNENFTRESQRWRPSLIMYWTYFYIWSWKTVGWLPNAFPGTLLLFSLPYLDVYLAQCGLLLVRKRNVFLCLFKLTMVYVTIPFTFVQTASLLFYPACTVCMYESNVAVLKERMSSSLAFRIWWGRLR